MITALITLAVAGIHVPNEGFLKTKPGSFLLKEKTAVSAGRSTEHEYDMPNQAASYYYFQRADKDGNWPDNALMIAKAQRDAMLAADGGGLFAGSWTALGPGNVGGRIRAIVVHPTLPTTMWLGAVAGGIWKTTNGGTSWAPQDDFMANLGVNSMAMDPTDPNVLYAGTGEGFFNTGTPGTSNNAFKQGNGIFKTYDGGTTWNQLPSTANPDFYFCNRLAISPVDHNIILVATNNGIFRSTDGGQTWTMRTTIRTFDVRFHPTDGNKAVAGRIDGIAQYSNDGGQTWNNATGITQPNNRVEIAYAKSQPTTVYAAVSNFSSSTIKVFQSLDGGVTYTLRTTGGGIPTYVNYNNVLWVDPTLPSRILVGGVNFYRSIDSGATFTGLGSIHSDQHVIVEHPSYNGTTNRQVFCGCDGGIYRLNDTTGNSFTKLDNTLGITQFYGAAVNDASGKIIGGAQDNGTHMFTGNPNVWGNDLIGGDGGFCAADPTDPNYFYGTYQYAAIQRSSDGGVNFSGLSVPESGSLAYNFTPFYILDPNNPNRMLVCGQRIYRANNVKTGNPPTWTIIKDAISFSPIRTGPPNAHFESNDPRNSSTIAVAQGNSDIIWVGYNNGQVWKTANGTATNPTWTRVDTNTPPLPDRFVSRIVIDPHDTNRVYVSFMGWTPDNVWRTTDGGTNWQQITGSGIHALPSCPVDSFAQNRLNPNWLYAGTDLGIFTSSDDGATWSTFTDGPGTVPISELNWRNDSTLMAVTMGRGVFQATINLTEEPIAASSYSLVRGILLGGRLQELLRSDDTYMTLRPGVVLSSTEAPVQLVLNGTSPISTCTALKFSVESSANQVNIGQTISLFNFTSGMYEDLETHTLTTSDVNVDVIVSSNPSRFIDPATNAVKAKISDKTVGPILSYPWNVKVDLARWILTP